MRQYIVRRLLQMIPVLIGVSIIVFLIQAVAPGNVVDNMLQQNPKMSEAKVEQLKRIYHLDRPKIVQYGYWAAGVLHGDFGNSYKYKQPVGHVMNVYIWNSFLLSLTSMFTGLVIAIPIGVVSATKQYSLFDNIFTVLALAGISIPSFFLGLLLIKWLAVDFRIFPVAGKSATGGDATGLKYVLDVMYHMFLPWLVLTLTGIASTMRYTRTSMLEVIRQDYVRTARAKGLNEKVVVYRHALRNALIPVITIVGLSLPALFSGSLMTETIFSWPGIGPVTIKAVDARDYPLLMGINMLSAILTLVGNLIADVMYALVDPRIRLK